MVIFVVHMGIFHNGICTDHKKCGLSLKPMVFPLFNGGLCYLMKQLDPIIGKK